MIHQTLEFVSFPFNDNDKLLPKVIFCFYFQQLLLKSMCNFYYGELPWLTKDSTAKFMTYQYLEGCWRPGQWINKYTEKNKNGEK